MKIVIFLPRVLLCFLLSAFLYGCSAEEQEGILNVDLQELSENSTDYRGREVRVSGVLKRSYSVEGNNLIGYELYADSKAGDMDTINLVFDSSQDGKSISAYTDKTVVIVGYFIGGNEQALSITNAVIE